MIARHHKRTLRPATTTSLGPSPKRSLDDIDLLPGSAAASAFTRSASALAVTSRFTIHSIRENNALERFGSAFDQAEMETDPVLHIF